MSKVFWTAFGLGLAIGAGIGAVGVLETLAPAPTFMWYLVATAAGCLLAAGIAACFPSLRGAAKWLAAAGVAAAFWPTIGLVASL